MAVYAFSDDEFEKACESLVGQPDVDEPWEFFTESHDVKIYRLYNKVDLTLFSFCAVRSRSTHGDQMFVVKIAGDK